MKEETNRLKHAWNAFRRRSPTDTVDGPVNYNFGSGSSTRQDRARTRVSHDRSIVNAIYNRMAIDVAAVNLKHSRADENGRYLEDIPSPLNTCLTVEANIDQSGRELILDVVLSMFDEGVVAIVPVDTKVAPKETGGFDILSMRVGKIVQWYPQNVRLEVYNENTGLREEIVMHKRNVAIVENPLYQVMNQPNSTLQRLIRKLNLLDAVDEKAGSGKLDIIIQLPHKVRTEIQKQQAEERRRAIEDQLIGSTYGIAYLDATERVTQLNRPAENNLMKNIEYLTSMLYSQLGLTESIFNGTADEAEMLNYYNRTIEPILTAIVEAMERKFLTKTARTQGQMITFFRDPFKLVPVTELANIADKFTRNEVLSSNEVRAIINYMPSKDPAADELRNKNLNQSKQAGQEVKVDEKVEDEEGGQNGRN